VLNSEDRGSRHEGVRDVAIVGAGPGGCALAATLSRTGLDVVLLEQSTFPRDKICGDFVSPTGLALLDRLGCLNSIERAGAPPIAYATLLIDGRRAAGGVVPQVGELPPFGLAIPRRRFDAILAEHAVAMGAKLIEEFRVDGFEVGRAGQRTGGTGEASASRGCVRIDGRQGGVVRSVHARLLVGADGARSIVARLAGTGEGVRRFGMAAVRAYAEGLPLDGSLQFFDEEYFPGYAWAFPTGLDTANVGVGVLTDGIIGQRISLRPWFDRLTVHLHSHARRRGARLRVGEPVGWPIQSYRPGARYSFERGLLVGEAAGLVDPLNGEGIPLAIESALLAARTICSAFEKGDFSAELLSGYDRACVERFDTDLRVSDLLVSTIANRHLAGTWIRALELFASIADRDPDYARTAGGVLAGVVPARDLVGPGMLAKAAVRAPLLLAAMLVRDAPRSVSEVFDKAFGWTRRAASVAEMLVSDSDQVRTWAREIAGKQGELARLLLRRGS